MTLRPWLTERLGWTATEQRAYVDGVRRVSIVVGPTFTLPVVRVDPPDNRVLEAAVEGHAGYIVTGDRHLLHMRAYEGIGIVTPAQFAALLSARR